MSGALFGVQKTFPDLSAAHFCMQKTFPGVSAAPFGTKTPSFGGLAAFRPVQAAPLIVKG